MRSRLLAVVVLVVALVAVPVLPASAATPASVPSAGSPPPGFDPSSSKWRKWMITQLGSVLGSAMPSSWRAEQIANEYALRHSPDALAAATGIGRGGSMTAIPETIEDYTAQAYERQIQNGTVAQSKKTAPATTVKNMTKGVAGVLSVFGGLELGTFLGASGVNLVGSFFGFDANGAVCSQAAGTPGEPLTSWVTGQDCEAWKLANEYVPNSDAADGWTGATYLGGSIQWVGWSPARSGTSYPCYVIAEPSSRVGPGGVGTITQQYWTGTAWSSPAGMPTAPSTHSSWNDVRAACPIISTLAGAVSSPNPIWRFIHVNGATIIGPVGTEPVETEGDPERYQTCTVTFTDGSTASSTGDTYRESDGAFVTPQCPPTPPGKVPAGVAITEHGNGAPQTVWEDDTTGAYQDWAESFPECGEQLCLLDLVRTTGGVAVSCFDLTEGCNGWWEDPSKSSSYECVYGGQSVDLDECAVYAGLFTPGRVEVGAPYSNPMTGVWSGGQSSPKPDEQAFGQGVQNPSATYRSCDGMASVGFDPVAWVMRPIQCALEWAFVPRPLVVDATFAGVEAAWATKPPAVLADAVGSITPPSGGSGCSVGVSLFGVDADIVNVCSGPMAALPIFSRLIVSAFVVVMVFNLVRRQVAGMAGYNLGQG